MNSAGRVALRGGPPPALESRELIPFQYIAAATILGLTGWEARRCVISRLFAAIKHPKWAGTALIPGFEFLRDVSVSCFVGTNRCY